MKDKLDNWFNQDNNSFNRWLWRWWMKWAAVTAIAILIGTATAPQSHGAFYIGSAWLNEGTSSGSQSTQGVTPVGNYGSFSSGVWSMFARWMF